MNLYIYNYNNYYNRIFKREGDDINDYAEYLNFGPVVGVYGFTPGDGVNTTQLIGAPDNEYYGIGDYLIAVEPISNTINSRWFIIDAIRTRNGQYNLTLHRDLMADYYDDIVKSPMYIEKANLSSDNPLIFNQEDSTVNQILRESKQLWDRTGCGWLVGYYDKKSQEHIKGTINTNTLDSLPAIQINSPIESWSYYEYNNTTFKSDPTALWYMIYAQRVAYAAGVIYSVNAFNLYGNVYSNSGAETGYLTGQSTLRVLSNYDNEFSVMVQKMKDYGRQDLQNIAKSYIDSVNVYEDLIGLNGQLLRDSTGRYFKITLTEQSTVEETTNITSGNLYEALTSFVSGFSNSTPNEHSFKLLAKQPTYFLQITELSQYNLVFDLSDNSNILNTSDCPYNIFAIPYGDVTIKSLTDASLDLKVTKELGLDIISSMQQQLQDYLYDIQLLPYFPMQELITDDGEITYTSDFQISFLTQGDEKKGVIFNVPKSKFDFDLDYKIEAQSDPIMKKIHNQCVKHRLCSPNYSNYFDFNIQQNNGLNYFNIDCDYKPFTPYIHINPNFGGLYGYDDNSPRGIVCGGDYSLTQIKDKWVEYQIQNKNFQSTFDRQIQNMEVQHGVQRTQEIVSSIAGIFQGAASGGLTGSMIGGGTGSIIGGVSGGLVSAGGAIADMALNEKLRSEALDYTRDMFKLQLGNIKALPNTISKVSSLNNNNKIVPVLETYCCTFEEIKMFVQKIAYNGMTIGGIGTINDYISNTWSVELNGSDFYDTGSMSIESQNYIKGKLIRFLSPPGENYHIVNSISKELDKGVYIK